MKTDPSQLADFVAAWYGIHLSLGRATVLAAMLDDLGTVVTNARVDQMLTPILLNFDRVLADYPDQPASHSE